jgi:hypothetical protein
MAKVYTDRPAEVGAALGVRWTFPEAFQWCCGGRSSGNAHAWDS